MNLVADIETLQSRLAKQTQNRNVVSTPWLMYNRHALWSFVRFAATSYSLDSS
jgi:hypothetical protein